MTAHLNLDAITVHYRATSDVTDSGFTFAPAIPTTKEKETIRSAIERLDAEMPFVGDGVPPTTDCVILKIPVVHT